MIELFLESTPSVLETIRNAITERNSAELRRAAHTLKGNCYALGAQQVGHLSKELEMIGQDGNLASSAKLSEDLRVAFEQSNQNLSSQRR